MPVVDDSGRVVGMVSEGDLLRRPENGTERQSSWWLRAIGAGDERARDFVKSRGTRARDVTTRDVVAVDKSASLAEIATTLERHRIKRVPVIRDGVLVGIVSRADLIRALAVSGTGKSLGASDRDIRAAIESSGRDAGVDMEFVGVVVVDGVASIWGMVESGAQKSALSVAAEGAPGVSRVDDRVTVMDRSLRSTIRMI